MLTEVAGVRKRFEEKWHKTGEKYNIFKVAKIDRDEVKICSVLADLLDPQGKHWQGSHYLRLFWKTIKQKKLLSQLDALDFEKTKITTELSTEENRRIDITLEDDHIFVPIEVKIDAGDQPKQIADYYEEAKKRNEIKKNDIHVPVLYLTKNGSDPSDDSKDGISENNYVKLSFKDDILAWLMECLGNTPETAVTVQKNLRQLIAAIESFCGKSEDAEMENEIFKLVTKNDDSVRAALDISRDWEMDFKNKSLEVFKGPITTQVKETLKLKGDVFHPNDGDGWDMIQIEIMGGYYVLDVNYDWKSFSIEFCGKRNKQIEDGMVRELYNHIKETKTEKKESAVEIYGWYPDFESENETLYFYKLWKLYAEHLQEVADKIINIAHALEGVKG